MIALEILSLTALANVTAATIALSAPFKYAVLTITADNVKELAYHGETTERLYYGVYIYGNEVLMRTPMADYGSNSQNQNTLKRYRNQPFKMWLSNTMLDQKRS